MKIYGELIRAQAEILSSDPSAGVEGRFWFNDTDDCLKYDADGTNIYQLADTGHSFVPATSSLDLGSSSSKWNYLYVNNIGASGGTATTTVNGRLSVVDNSKEVIRVDEAGGLLTILCGPGFTAAGEFWMYMNRTDSVFKIVAGSTDTADSGIWLYGDTHATLPGIVSIKGSAGVETYRSSATLTGTHQFYGSLTITETGQQDFNILAGSTGSANLIVASGGTQNNSSVGKLAIYGYRADDTSTPGNPAQVEFHYGNFSGTSRQLAEIVGRNTSTTVGSAGGHLAFRISNTSGTLRDTHTIDDSGQLNFFGSTSGQIGLATAATTSSYDIILPSAIGSANQVLAVSSVSSGDMTLEWTTLSGTGDVVGPSSATDNALVLFDGTTGKLVKDSSITVNSSSDVDGIGEINFTSITDSAADRVFETYTRDVSSSVDVRGVAVSSSSGSFSSTSNSFTDVTNLSATIVTSGKPVKLELISVDTGTSPSFLSKGGVSVRNTSGSTNDVIGELMFRRDSTDLGKSSHGKESMPNLDQYFFGSGQSFVDNPSAGTYTYKVRCRVSSGTIEVTSMKLVAYEL